MDLNEMEVIVAFVMNQCDDRTGDALLEAGLGCKTATEIAEAALADSEIAAILSVSDDKVA